MSLSITQYPDRSLDPPESGTDWRGRRERLLTELTRDAIRDMVSDALDDEFIDLVARLVVKQDSQTACEHLTVGKAFNERIAAKVERHLEATE